MLKARFICLCVLVAGFVSAAAGFSAYCLRVVWDSFMKGNGKVNALAL
jgi:hypothetical protein